MGEINFSQSQRQRKRHRGTTVVESPEAVRCFAVVELTAKSAAVVSKARSSTVASRRGKLADEPHSGSKGASKS